jgi:flavin reductase (DIM6/NTAB) family NADH-FMN oxidoreductase RutF
VSLDPPLVSVCLHKESSLLEELLNTKVWALSILDVGGDDIARTFARDREHRTAALRTLATTPGERTGALVLDSMGWLECALREHFDVGDHVILIGDVLAADVTARRPPLIFLRGKFYALGECRSTAPCGEPDAVAAIN